MTVLLRFFVIPLLLVLSGCGDSVTKGPTVDLVFLNEDRTPRAGVQVQWFRTEGAGYHDSGRTRSVAEFESDSSGRVSIPKAAMKKHNHLTTFAELGPLAHFDGDTLVVGPIGEEFRWDYITRSNGVYTVVLPSDVGATE